MGIQPVQDCLNRSLASIHHHGTPCPETPHPMVQSLAKSLTRRKFGLKLVWRSLVWRSAEVT